MLFNYAATANNEDDELMTAAQLKMQEEFKKEMEAVDNRTLDFLSQQFRPTNRQKREDKANGFIQPLGLNVFDIPSFSGFLNYLKNQERKRFCHGAAAGKEEFAYPVKQFDYDNPKLFVNGDFPFEIDVNLNVFDELLEEKEEIEKEKLLKLQKYYNS